MSTEAFVTDEDVAEARQYPTLGPTYFAAQRIAEGVVAPFTAEHLRPLVDKAAEQFQEALWQKVEDYLWADTESNLQGSLHRAVDDVVKALLGGNQWALERYVIKGYDTAAIRKELAASIRDQLLDARLADLEAENQRLTDEIATLRQWSR